MPSGGIHPHRMRVTNLQDEDLAIHRGAIADALDFQILLEAVGHTDDHVAEQRAGQAVQRAVLALVVRALDRDRRRSRAARIIAGVNCCVQLALRALDRDPFPSPISISTLLGTGIGLRTNSRHLALPVPAIRIRRSTYANVES